MITKEALNKAFSLLDEANALIKSNTTNALITEASPTLLKGEDMDWDNDDMKKALDHAKFLQKGGLDKEAGCGVMCKGGFSIEVSQASWEKALALANAVGNGGSVKAEEVPLMKSEDVAALVKGEIGKSLEPVTNSISNVNDAILKGFDGLNQIVKSMQETNDALQKSNTELAERLERVEASPAGGRKSATNAQYFERFKKSEDSGTLDENCFDVTTADGLDRLGTRLLAENKAIFAKSNKNDEMLEGIVNSIECHKKVPDFGYRRLAQMGIKLQVPSA